MTTDADRVIVWGFVVVVTWGIILAGLRVRRWIEHNKKPDPLNADVVETRYSLRREK